ncbi:MAG: hypothetical protein Q4B52_00390 [Tissierellia bacterium]|nr:hypothetical protein [Tissierellia bacterium]
MRKRSDFFKNRMKTPDRFINTYALKTKVSSILWLLSGISILSFGLYFWEYFEITSGIISIVISIIKFTNKVTVHKVDRINKFENRSIHLYMFLIVFFSLVNPIGIIPIIFDIYRREYTLRKADI